MSNATLYKTVLVADDAIAVAALNYGTRVLGDISNQAKKPSMCKSTSLNHATFHANVRY